MNNELRERVARALSLEEYADDAYWRDFLPKADAVLAELKPELQPQAEPVAVNAYAELREAAKAFYNATVAEPGLLLSSRSAELRDAAKEAGDRLRALLAAAPQPQASADADDVALMDEALNAAGYAKRGIYGEAWQRIRADYERMGVVK